MSTIFIGDIDEFYCDSIDGDNRWAVWLSYVENNRFKDKLLGRFNTYQEAEQYRNSYVLINPNVLVAQ